MDGFGSITAKEDIFSAENEKGTCLQGKCAGQLLNPIPCDLVNR